MGRTLALLSSDLLMGSRVAAAAGRFSGRMVPFGERLDDTVVVVDLNPIRGKDSADEMLDMIRKIRSREPEAVVIGFCGHDEKMLRIAAMEAGADQVVTNGGLADAVARLLSQEPGMPSQ